MTVQWSHCSIDLHEFDGLLAQQVTFHDFTEPGMEYQAPDVNLAPAYLVPTQPVLHLQSNGHIHEPTDVSNCVDIDAELSSSATTMAAPEEVLFAEPASDTVSDQPFTKHPNNLDAHTHSNYKADIAGLEHQSVNVLAPEGSHESDVVLSRCAL